MRYRNRHRIAAAIVASALVAAGCSGDDDSADTGASTDTADTGDQSATSPDDTGDTGDTGADTAEPATDETSSSEDPAPTAIDAATISLPAPNQSFDPTATVSATDRVASSLMNSTLYVIGPDGLPSPGLAESLEFNDDLTQATVALRDAMFSDGSPITAEDVAATFTRHMGIEESTIGATTDRITSVTAAEDGTVVFEFPAPYPSFEGEAGGLAIYPASAMDDADAYFENPPVTSGQYTIAENWAANRLVLTANPNYWGPPPAVTEVTLTVIEDANSALSQLQAGQIDYAGDLAPNFITQIADDPNLRIEASPVFGFFDLRLQNASGPMADANVRRAVNAAIDREAIVSSIWGDFNVPLSGFWPPEMPGNDPDKSVARDLDAAREFLVGTECESGCTVDMMYSDQDFAFSSQLALMVQSQLAEIGIDVQLERLDASTLVDRLFASDYDISPGAMPSDGNFPDPLLNRALLGTGFLMAEFTGYNSEEMNALIEIVNTTTGADRDQALADIEALFAQDQPYVTIAPWVRLSATTLPEGTFQLVGPRALMFPAG